MSIFKNRKSDIFTTFVILIAISALVLSFLFVVISRTQDSYQIRRREKAFYIAEAGIRKAIWALMTPAGLGGMGASWRPTNFSESLGDGSYSFSIFDGSTSGTIVIISTGEAGGQRRTIRQIMTSSTLPPAFSYSMYNNGALELRGSSCVIGDLFANGNITIQKNSNHPSGKVYTAPGYKVNGQPGESPPIIPTMPALNSTFYDNQIAIARTYPTGNQTISNINLNGGTIYVNGNATISGNITGGGRIVATGTVTINSAIVDSNTTIISNGIMTINGPTNIDTGAILYSPVQIRIPGNPRIIGSLLSARITANGNPTIMGILFSWDVATELDGNVTVYGSVVNPSATSYSGNINLEYRSEYIPPYVEGLSAGGFSLIKGSWKEL